MFAKTWHVELFVHEEGDDTTVRDVVPGWVADLYEPIFRRILETGKPLSNHEFVSHGPLGESRDVQLRATGLFVEHYQQYQTNYPAANLRF